MSEYAACHKCGGVVAEQIMDHEYRIRGRIVMVFENVPVGVCQKCGEKLLKGEIARKIEDIALKKTPQKKAVFVPVVSLQ